MFCSTMSRVEDKHLIGRLNERLSNSGFRFTPQRQHVYAVLSRSGDHPTAEEMFIRAKQEMPDISMATVYNCLDALVKSGLAKQVMVERGAIRFCPNMTAHSHFYCDSCQGIFDIEVPVADGWQLPKGYEAERFDLTIHGRCPECNSWKR